MGAAEDPEDAIVGGDDIVCGVGETAGVDGLGGIDCADG